MKKTSFDKPFTQQEAIPEAGIEQAVELMRSGRLHRYNTLADETAEAALLERDYAAWMGQRYCLACTSGGYAHYAEKSVAIGFLPRERIADGAEFEIEILGKRCPARIARAPLFDPLGERMRG